MANEILCMIYEDCLINIYKTQKERYKKIFIIKTFIVFIFIICYSIVLKNWPDIVLSRKRKIETKKLELYLNICNETKLLHKQYFHKIENPKISIISPVHNREKYILRFLRSIQNQCFDGIEIILVDDFSEDNSVKLIENYQKEDKRIILIKHNKNKGTLISRNHGAIITLQ